MIIDKFKFTRKNILILSSFAVLFVVMILSVVSFAFGKHENDRSESSLQEYTSIVIDNSIEAENSENSPDNAVVSNVFAESSVVEDDSSENSYGTEHGWVINEYGYTYVYGDCGYDQFNYKNTALDRYVRSLNNLKSCFDDSTRVFSITVPVSSTFADVPREIYVMDDFYNQSQSAFVATLAQRTDNSIIHLQIVNLLEERYDNGEYVFFRTDKNWTSLGAYTAYSSFCENAGFSQYSLENFKKIELGEFLGSFYSATNSPNMSDNPDEMICYSCLPTVNTSLTVFDDGLLYSGYNLCGNNVSSYNTFDFYLGRDAGRYEISTSSDGGTLLIIGDTSAHPLVPFLCSHYSKIDVIDPRKFDITLNEFFNEHHYDDCIIMCYSTNAVNGDFVPSLNVLTGAIIDE